MSCCRPIWSNTNMCALEEVARHHSCCVASDGWRCTSWRQSLRIHAMYYEFCLLCMQTLSFMESCVMKNICLKARCSHTGNCVFNGTGRFLLNLWFKISAMQNTFSNTRALNHDFGNVSASLIYVIISFASRYGSDSISMKVSQGKVLMVLWDLLTPVTWGLDDGLTWGQGLEGHGSRILCQ